MKTLKVSSHLFLLLTLILSLSPSAQAKKYYGQSNDFLTYGVGGRALALGGAYSALAEDASAPYWNPAGLDRLNSHQMMFMHTDFFEGTTYDYFGSVHPFRRIGGVGIAFVNLRSGGFEKTNAIGDSLGEGSVSQSALFGSYAKSLWGVSLGTSLKMVREDNLNNSGTGFGLDVGALAPLGRFNKKLRPLTVSLVAGNILEPKITLKNTANVYGTNLRAGLAMKLMNERMIASFDMNKMKNEPSFFTTGVELNPMKVLSLRFGYNQIPDLTYGIGLNLGSWKLDYGLSSHDLGMVHKLSLSYSWGNVYEAKAEPKKDKWGKSKDIALEGLTNMIKFGITVPKLSVKEWQLLIRDGEKVLRTFEGFGRPPEEIPWDVHDELGKPVPPGDYVYEWTVVYEDEQLWRSRGKLHLKTKASSGNLDIDHSVK